MSYSWVVLVAPSAHAVGGGGHGALMQSHCCWHLLTAWRILQEKPTGSLEKPTGSLEKPTGRKICQLAQAVMGTVMCVDWLLTSAGVMLATYCRSRGSANCLTTPPQASRSAACGSSCMQTLAQSAHMLHLPPDCVEHLSSLAPICPAVPRPTCQALQYIPSTKVPV